MKRCTKCGIEYPATTEYWHHSKRFRDGLRNQCKICRRAEAAAYHLDNRDKVNQRNKNWNEANSEKRREYNKRYDAENREKINARKRNYRQANIDKLRDYENQWRSANPDKVRAAQQRYRTAHPERVGEYEHRYRIENRDKRNAQRRRYYQEHRENALEYAANYRVVNREKISDYAIRYRTRNPEVMRRITARRRALKRSLPATLTTADWQRCLDYFGGMCVVCGKPPGLWHFLAEEHWIAITDPRPDNPGTVPENIVPMCHSQKDGQGGCNNSKSNKDPLEWLEQRFGKRKAKQINERVQAYFEWVTNALHQASA